MTVVTECLSQVSLGDPQIHNNIALFPLISAKYIEPRYLLLDDALAQRCARVTEVSDQGVCRN